VVGSNVGGGATAATAELAGVGQWSMDLASGAKRWDERTRAIFGLAPGEPVPDRATWRQRFMRPDDAEESARRAAESLRTGEPYEMEFRVRRGDGQVRWLFTRAVFNPANRGEVLGVTVDITGLRSQTPGGGSVPERVRTEVAAQVLQQLRSRLSHELRTPLNAVIGFAQLLELDRAHPLVPEQRSRVQAIQTAAWQLLAQIDALLADASGTRRTVPPEPVDPD
jgi:PAS domain S-box-containing protein